MKMTLPLFKTGTLLSSLFIFLTFLATAQPEPTLAWAKNNLPRTGLSTFDDNGNLYVTGHLDVNTTLTIDGHSITCSAPLGGGFIAKYDNNGNCVWLKEIPFVVQFFNNINPHKFLCLNGKLYLFVCYRQNNIIMDGFQFPPYQNSGGDLVLIQMDATEGSVQWIRTMARPGSYGSLSYDDFEIYLDDQSNIHTLGMFSNTFIFDTGDTLSHSGNTMNVDAFHAVYDTLGNLKSAHTLGVNNTNPGMYSYEYFHMDQEKNVYRFVKDTKTFIKYNEHGDTLFTKTFSSGATITGMTVDPWQNVFLSGYFSAATVSFDGLTTAKIGGTTDGILVKFNSNDGTVEWLKNQGYTACDRYDYINSDAIGNVYVLNEQYGICTSPRMSLVVKYNNAGDKIWGKKIDIATAPGLNTSTQAQVNASNISLSPDGGTIILTGSYRGGINLDNSVSYGGNGENNVGFIAQYGSCNTPQPTLTVSNQQFCQGDSTMLTVTTLPDYSYLWSNGDTINTSIYVSSSGEYSVVAIQNEECYAQSQEVYITENPLPDTSVMQQEVTLTATSGNTYQWLDCENNHVPIVGANQVSFTPVQNGTYAVKVTSPAGCTDTSACFTINNLSIMEQTDLSQHISVYPNPATNEINIQSSLAIQALRILDLQGKELIKTTGEKVSISNLSCGVYMIEITTSKGVGMKKIIKE